MSFNIDYSNDINQDEIETTELSYPMMGFSAGGAENVPEEGEAIRMKYAGGFYVTVETAEKLQNVSWDGWQKDRLVVKRGKNAGQVIPVMWNRKITFAQVERRRQWVTVENDGVQTIGFPWSKWEMAKSASSLSRANGHMQAVLLVKGLEAAGPFVLGMYGTKQMAWFGEDESYRTTGVLSVARNTIVKAANDYTRAVVDYQNAKTGQKSKANAWDIHAFWITAGASINPDGTPRFIKCGKSGNEKLAILPLSADMPAMGFHDEAMAIIRKDLSILEKPESNPVVKKMLDILGKYQVPANIWQAIKDTRSELDTRGWKAQWDNAQPPTTVTPTAAAQAPTVNVKEAEEAGY